MTTPAAERLYLAQHEVALEHQGNAIYNPHDKPIAELPVIYGLNNGGSPGWLEACALAQDGHTIGGHCCSHEGYMPHDLGILEGSRPEKHEEYRKHYPDGYRMEFVPTDEIKEHEGLQDAIKLANEIYEKKSNSVREIQPKTE